MYYLLDRALRPLELVVLFSTPVSYYVLSLLPPVDNLPAYSLCPLNPRSSVRLGCTVIVVVAVGVARLRATCLSISVTQLAAARRDATPLPKTSDTCLISPMLWWDVCLLFIFAPARPMPAAGRRCCIGTFYSGPLTLVPDGLFSTRERLGGS